MNKKFTYLLLVLGFLGLSAFIVIKYDLKIAGKTAEVYHFKDRRGAAAQLPEWTTIRSNGEALIRKINSQPDDKASRIALASLYIQEARITGDFGYYNSAAMKYLGDVLALEPANFDALLLKALIQLSDHHFPEALQTAKSAQKINPYNAFVYGIMVDASVELGQYEQAVAFSDNMMSVRPDIRSYSRVSYLREIHGDLPGAIEAMKMAVEAGGYGDEGTEWARIQLARLYENTGQLKAAEMHYLIALEERPGYPYAQVGLGHLALGKGDHQKALSFYQQADTIVHDMTIKMQIAKLHGIMNQGAQEKRILDGMISDLETSVSKGETAAHHHADLELSQLYLLKGDAKRSLKHALAEYNRRPENIEVNEWLAWVYHENGNIQQASNHISKALSTQCKNPELLCRAGLIYYSAGEHQMAARLIKEALHNDPNIDPDLKQKSMGITVQ